MIEGVSWASGRCQLKALSAYGFLSACGIIKSRLNNGSKEASRQSAFGKDHLNDSVWESIGRYLVWVISKESVQNYYVESG